MKKIKKEIDLDLTVETLGFTKMSNLKTNNKDQQIINYKTI